MNKLFKRILIGVTMALTTVLLAGVFTSCTYGLNQEEKKRQEGYNCCVTYDANGGTYGSNSSVTYALVKENSLAPAPGYVDANTQASVKVPTRRNYQLINETKASSEEEKNLAAIASKSWFQAKTDEDGKVIYEGEGENRTPVLVTGEPWNFAKDKVTEDITLVAQWTKVYRFILCLTEEVEQEDGTMVTSEREIRSYTVNPGATISDKLYEKKDGELFRRPDYIRPSLSNYTFLDFYMDEDLTNVMPMDLVHPGTRTEEVTVVDPETNQEKTETVETNDVKIYVKYLAGRFEFISNENKKTLTNASKWYLLEDVDYADSVAWDAQNNFTGTIYGNGYALKNVTVTSLAEKKTAGYKAHSIFGTMKGLVKDLILENVTLKVNVSEFFVSGNKIPGEQRIGFLAYEISSEGKFEGVTVKDCRIVRKNETYYDAVIHTDTACRGLYFNAPAEGQENVLIVETSADNVTTIKIETEE